MPIEYKTPGVYIEELSSNVTPVAGVPTSITAFIGRALRGPVKKAVKISNFSEFQQKFGGLWAESSLGYSLLQYFENGGSEAFIVRLFKQSMDPDSPPSKTQIGFGDLHFEAANEGSWGENLIVTLDLNVTQEVADNYELDRDKMFNLIIQETAVYDNKRRVVRTESYAGLTIEDHQNRVDIVLKELSELLRYKTGNKFPSDLSSVHDSANNGAVTYSVVDSIDILKKKIEELSEDDKDKKKALRKQLNALKSSDGESLDADSFIGPGKEDSHEGLYALEDIHTDEMFNLMCIPPYNVEDVDPEVVTKAAEYCEKKRTFLLVDPPSSWKNVEDAENGLSKIGTYSKNAALYFPRVLAPDPLNNYRPKEFAPSGAIAGIIARTDNQLGVWKAPAGIEAVLQGVEPSININNDQNGRLNPLGINCLRTFPVYGNVVWGARTLQGNDMLQSEWKYLNVRRLALYIEESLYRGTQWAVFEPNDQPLWSSLKISVDSFMNDLFSSGAFAGGSHDSAFFVRVDETTTTPNDIDEGIVNILVGFAPTRPAEFIILKIAQKTPPVDT
ncbi:MAG: phage tail sheath C-terminal domain-containing protein [Thermodesulfobacteriota bacterium]